MKTQMMRYVITPQCSKGALATVRDTLNFWAYYIQSCKALIMVLSDPINHAETLIFCHNGSFKNPGIPNLYIGYIHCMLLKCICHDVAHIDI